MLAKDWFEDRDGQLDRIVRLIEDESDDADGPDQHEAEEEFNDDASPVLDATSDSPPDGNGQLSNQIDGESSLDLADSSEVEIPAAMISESETTNSASTSETIVIQSSTKAKQYLEFRDGSSSKFWEIEVHGNQHTVRFGRIGTAGQKLTKTFPDAGAAGRDAARLVAEKTRKGYRTP